MRKMAEVLLCAHRGERVTGDGNTLSAFRNALSVGVDMIETDVRMTGDGVLILMHDEVLDTTTDGTGLIAERTLNEVRAVNAMAHAKLPCAPEPPPTLLCDRPSQPFAVRTPVSPPKNVRQRICIVPPAPPPPPAE